MEDTKLIKFIIGMMVCGTVGFSTAVLLFAAKKGDEYEI